MKSAVKSIRPDYPFTGGGVSLFCSFTCPITQRDRKLILADPRFHEMLKSRSRGTRHRRSSPTINTLLDILVIVSSLAAFLAIRDRQRRRGLPYPPGPRPLPLVGNLFDIPKESSWLTYADLSKKHGDILSFRVLGTFIVVLNSLKANKDLREGRSDVYSDRIRIPILEMMKLEWNIVFSKYNNYSFRQGRKLLDRHLRPATVPLYRPVLEARTHDFLAQVSANPDELEAHIHHMTGSLILALGYGYDVKGFNDRKVEAAGKMIDVVSATALPGALLVNDLPFLRHIPKWVPWLSYKPIARYGYNIGQEVLHEPMEFVRESILNGTAQPSLALESLHETESLEESERKKAEDVIAGALGTMYFAGTDTTSHTLLSFVVGILLRPEIQKMAQEELDTVTGKERLPTLEDRPRLPFVGAVCKEVTRWRPAGPLAVPNTATRDDVYEGFFIPKGAVVLTNIWAILHNPATYTEPDSFKPERYINPDGSLRDDPVLASLYGFGKRICPGRHLADAAIFIVIASFLASFNVKKDINTVEGPDAYPYTGNGASRPYPFKCSITPRDRKAEELIMDLPRAV